MAELERWRKAGLFIPYFGKNWEGDPAALRKVEEWIGGLKDHLHKDGLGLLLMGEPGRGKTLLAHLAADAVLDSEKDLHATRRRDVFLALTVQGYLDLFRQCMDCMDIVRKTGDDDAGQRYLKAQETIEAVQTRIKVVLIDDIGKEHTTATGYAQHQIERLVRARGNRGLPSIITTNLDMEGLGRQYGPSFTSYLLQVCLPVLVHGSDYRKRDGSQR